MSFIPKSTHIMSVKKTSTLFQVIENELTSFIIGDNKSLLVLDLYK